MFESLLITSYSTFGIINNLCPYLSKFSVNNEGLLEILLYNFTFVLHIPISILDI